VALNLQNDNTIEFRIFRGTLKFETFAAALQLVHTIITNLFNVPLDNISSLTWETLTSSSHPQLNAYMKEIFLDSPAKNIGKKCSLYYGSISSACTHFYIPTILGTDGLCYVIGNPGNPHTERVRMQDVIVHI